MKTTPEAHPDPSGVPVRGLLVPLSKQEQSALAAFVARQRQVLDRQREHLETLRAKNAELLAKRHAAEGRALDALGERLAVALTLLSALDR